MAKVNLKQVSLENKLNGKWGEYGFTKFRILGSFSGKKDTVKKIQLHTSFPPIQTASDFSSHWPAGCSGPQLRFPLERQKPLRPGH